MKRHPWAALACLLDLSARELWRNKLGLALLVAIPGVFIGAVLWTAGRLPVPIKLFFSGETLQVILSQRSITLIFAAAAVTGFLVSYYALILFHQDFEYYRYCVFMGLPPRVFAAARFLFFMALAAGLGLLITLVLGRIVVLQQPLLVFLGFALMGVIYGACGGIIGSFTRDFLPALLMVALLADIDAAWLQNPVYYSLAQHDEIIRWLPAYYPCQFIFSSVFTDRGNPAMFLRGAAYAAVLLGVLFLVIHLRMRGVWRRAGRISRR